MKVAFSLLLAIFSSLLIASCSATGVLEEQEVDADNDSFSDKVDCDDTNPDIHPGASEICGDGIDQDCNGSDLECGCLDSDNDGFEDETCGGNDCDDAESSIHPGASEICGDGIDQDCAEGDAPCAVLDAPTLIAPENGATDIVLQPSFAWSSVGADSYELHASVGNETVLQVEVMTTDFVPSEELAGESVYYWRVRGLANGELGPWSPIWDFTTGVDDDAFCGDNSCDPPSESCDTCSSDCGVCPPSCDDGIKNQDEEGIDCGGSCSECGGTGEHHFIVQNGAPLADIVISPSAPPSVSLAAEYLQEGIDSMSGATLPINNSPSSSYSIHVYVGRSSHTDALGVTDAGCHDEGFKMVASDGYLVLLGEDDRQNFPGFGGNPGLSTTPEWDAYVSNQWGESFLWGNDVVN